MTAQGLMIRNNAQDILPRETSSAMQLAEIMSYAEMFYKSGLFSDTAQASQAAVKILAGQELGMGPFQAMQSIHIIKGKACLSAGAMATLIKGSGKYDYRVSEKTDNHIKIDYFQRTANGYEPIGESVFTREDAKRQGTQNMDKFPANMLFNRAMSNGAKWYCADIFGGPIYTPEEMGAVVNGATDEIVSLPALPHHANALQDKVASAATANHAKVSVTTRLRNAVRKVWEKAKRDLRTAEVCAALSVPCEGDGSEVIDLETFGDAGLVLMLHYAIQGGPLGTAEPPTSEQILAEAKAFLA